MNKLELYGKTMDRLHRAGCHTDQERIIYLAEEIEHYRARIAHMMQATPPEHIDPADRIMQFAATSYISPGLAVPYDEITRQARAQIIEQLAVALDANGAIELQVRQQKYFPHITEYLGRLRVVMPRKEAAGNG